MRILLLLVNFLTLCYGQDFLGQIGRAIGFDLSGLSNMNVGGQRLGNVVDQVAGNVLQNFFAPKPGGDIPPHVYRRLVRFCTRHRNHPRCQGHPEWIAPAGANLGPAMDLGNAFPDWTPFRLPPVPQMALQNFLAGVPSFLQQVLPPSTLGNIPQAAKARVQNTCRATRTCKRQQTNDLNKRAVIAEHEAAVRRRLFPGRRQADIDNDVELRMTRTFQVKQALLRQAGLDQEVDPVNDGTFQHDILLTEPQANKLINEINQSGRRQAPAALRRAPARQGWGPSPNQGWGQNQGWNGGWRGRRSALFLEATPTQRWPQGVPIPYMFDQSLSEADKAAVRQAIAHIQSKTCVRFTEVSTKPAGSHIYYVKVASPTFCGLSYIGRVETANIIYLSFMCNDHMGVAIHETLHALGLQHEQLRGDRDDYITINWENVNPQMYDFFAISDSQQFTSYGVTYDYGSIMHYKFDIASSFPGKATMTPKISPATNQPLMGQRRGMSAKDVEIVTKMYCMPGCEDKNVYCGAWATKGFCRKQEQFSWMIQNCQKSCGFCGGGK